MKVNPNPQLRFMGLMIMTIAAVNVSVGAFIVGGRLAASIALLLCGGGLAWLAHEGWKT